MTDVERCSYTLHVNGVAREVRDAWVGASLLDVVRDELGLPGTKNACGQGRCGSCSLLVDGELLAGCLVPAAAVGDAAVTTVEGLEHDDDVAGLRAALLDAGAVQCGFCTPGMVVAAHAALRDRAQDREGVDDAVLAEELSGNLCRCTGYGRILAAVTAVAAERSGAAGAGRSA